MKLSRRRFLSIAAAAGMAPGAGTAAEVWTGRALGADARVELHGMGPEAVAAVPDLLARVERQFSLYNPRSELARLNRDGQMSETSAEFARLVARCDDVNRATDGRFDPTVQSLWAAYAEGAPLGPARAAVGWDRVQRVGGAVSLAPGQRLTLNGIAQGFATDLVAAHLRDAGARRVLVNIGEFAGLGGPWRVGLADPLIGLYGWRSLSDGALATSSPGALRLGAGRAHILDPRDQKTPIWSSVTVEAEDATLADAASTAFCLADRQAIARMAQVMPGIRRVTLVSPAGDVLTL